MYCDSAIQYSDRNYVEAYGNVRFTQGDTITLTGKKLTYDGATQCAMVSQNVVLQDRKMTLKTNALNYDSRNKLASYQTGGEITDADNQLTSKKGYYNTQSKIFWFKKDVVLVNKKENFTLTSDTLEYNSLTKIATFRGPTQVVKKNDVLHTTHGEYDTKNARHRHTGRAKIISGHYELEADNLYYDEITNTGIAKSNVKLTSTKDSVVIEGDKANYWGKMGLVKITGRPVMKSKMQKDTLYLVADTLVSIDKKDETDTTKSIRRLLAYQHVKIFKENLQAKCDSLAYEVNDSTLFLFSNPVMWSGKNQIFADSINIQIANKKIYCMNANVNSFIISEDTAHNYNQVKGRKMTAYFKDDKIKTVYVDGNGETIYHALDEKKRNRLIGLNRTECSNMTISFDSGSVRKILFLKRPSAKFIPPHEINADNKQLKGFMLHYADRPKKNDVIVERSAQ